MMHRVAPRDIEGVTRDVGCDHAGTGDLARQHDRDAAAPGPDVHDNRAGLASDQCKRFFDDEFGFVPRYQHVGADFECETPELACSENVGDRLSAFAARHERLIVEKEDTRGSLVASGEKAGAVPPQHLTRKHLGVEVREIGADAGGHETVSCTPHQILNCHHDAVASFSFSDW